MKLPNEDFKTNKAMRTYMCINSLFLILKIFLSYKTMNFIIAFLYKCILSIKVRKFFFSKKGIHILGMDFHIRINLSLLGGPRRSESKSWEAIIFPGSLWLCDFITLNSESLSVYICSDMDTVLIFRHQQCTTQFLCILETAI